MNEFYEKTKRFDEMPENWEPCTETDMNKETLEGENKVLKLKLKEKDEQIDELTQEHEAWVKRWDSAESEFVRKIEEKDLQIRALAEERDRLQIMHGELQQWWRHVSVKKVLKHLLKNWLDG